MKLWETSSLEQAAAYFLEGYEPHRQRVECSKRKMLDIYAHKTPEAPYVEFGLSQPLEFALPAWAETENQRALLRSLQGILNRLEQLPEFDFVPSIGIPGIKDSGYIARLYGSQCSATPGGGLVVDQPAIQSAEQVEELAEPNLSQNSVLAQMKEFVAMTAGLLHGTVEMAYPQMQGPATNSFRILPQEEGLMATLTNPEEMSQLGLLTAKASVAILKSLFQAADGSHFFRPRARFYQPAHIKGLFVDDWISTVSPRAYYEIYRDSFDYMHRQIGEIYFHTCGPAMQVVDILAELPGVRAFETCFISGQSKTTADLGQLKERAAGRLMAGSFGSPLGKAVTDEENLTYDLLLKLSQGGGFALQAFGVLEDAQRLSAQLFG